MWFSALCAIEQAEFHSLCLETLPFSILSVFSSAPGHTPVFRTSRFLVTEPCCQGPATSCKIFPGPEMAETSRNVILFDAMCLCHSSVLMRSPRCACYVTSGPSCDPDTRPDWRGLMHQPQVRWEVWYYSIIKRLCVSPFILIVSVGSAAWPVNVENVTGDCLETETIVGIKGQALGRLQGADSHGWRPCYHGLKRLSFS